MLVENCGFMSQPPVADMIIGVKSMLNLTNSLTISLMLDILMLLKGRRKLGKLLNRASRLKTRTSTKHLSEQLPKNHSWQCPIEPLLDYLRWKDETHQDCGQAKILVQYTSGSTTLSRVAGRSIIVVKGR